MSCNDSISAKERLQILQGNLKTFGCWWFSNYICKWWGRHQWSEVTFIESQTEIMNLYLHCFIKVDVVRVDVSSLLSRLSLFSHYTLTPLRHTSWKTQRNLLIYSICYLCLHTYLRIYNNSQNLNDLKAVKAKLGAAHLPCCSFISQVYPQCANANNQKKLLLQTGTG